MSDIFGPLTPLLVLAMIAGLVEFAKKLGINGNWSLGLSMALGVMLGLLMQLAEMYPEISPWVRLVVYGILFGLTASGLYDIGKRFLSR